MSVPMLTPAQARSLYALLVESNEQAMPMLLLGFADDMQPCALTGISEELPLAEAIVLAGRDVSSHRGERPEWAVISYEGWYAMMTPEEMAVTRPRKMAERGDPRVRDCVFIVAAGPDGPWASAQPFTRTEAGVRWDEVTETAEREQMGGDTLPALEQVLGFSPTKGGDGE